GLSGSGHATEYRKAAFGHCLFDRAKQIRTHGLVAAHHAWIAQAQFCRKPFLRDPGAMSAAEAIQITVRIGLRKLHPGSDSFGPNIAADQLMPQGDGRFLAMALVADADLVALLIIHQGTIDSVRERALLELYGRAYIHKRKLAKKQRSVVVGVFAHDQQILPRPQPPFLPPRK